MKDRRNRDIRRMNGQMLTSAQCPLGEQGQMLQTEVTHTTDPHQRREFSSRSIGDENEIVFDTSRSAQLTSSLGNRAMNNNRVSPPPDGTAENRNAVTGGVVASTRPRSLTPTGGTRRVRSNVNGRPAAAEVGNNDMFASAITQMARALQPLPNAAQLMDSYDRALAMYNTAKEKNDQQTMNFASVAMASVQKQMLQLGD